MDFIDYTQGFCRLQPHTLYWTNVLYTLHLRILHITPIDFSAMDRTDEGENRIGKYGAEMRETYEDQ